MRNPLLYAEVLLLGLCAGCGTQTPKLLPPSNLAYPQNQLVATLDAPIAALAPTVSGVVSGYSVNPSLPMGLSLDATTGTIAGTPIALSSKAVYTITAANSAGSTTANVQITVNDKPPTRLSYSSPLIAAVVGTPIAPDTPTADQPIVAYSASPALPAGLIIDPSSGVISGTPATAAPNTAYTITGSNSGGSTTAQVTIKVTAHSVLLNLGHWVGIQNLQTNGSQVLSEDIFGHWVLWDYATGNRLQSGDGAGAGMALAGPLAVASTSQGILVFSASSGNQISTLPLSSWFSLASDGSYIVTGTNSALTVWNANGGQQFARTGDYHAAKVFAAPGQVQVAMGSAGSNVIETLSVPSGNSTLSPSFPGAFDAWFTDGHRFFTTAGNTVSIYSDAGVRQTIATLPTTAGLGGMGNWFWIVNSGTELQIYQVGGVTPVQSYQSTCNITAIASAGTLGAFCVSGPAQISIVNLSGTSPAKLDFAISPVAFPTAFAAASPSEWLVGNSAGVILDGAALPAAHRYFGYGQATSIAASKNVVAVATASGQIVVYDLTKSSAVGTIDFLAGHVALSADGAILSASNSSYYAQYVPDRSLNTYSLPSLALLDSIASQYNTDGSPYLLDFTLAGSGAQAGQLLYTGSSGPGYSQLISSLSGSPSIPLGTDPVVPVVSPDGTLAAVANGPLVDSLPLPQTQSTNIFKNGLLLAAVNGIAVGWIDNDRLLAQVQSMSPGLAIQTTPVIYTAEGATVATLPPDSIPAMLSPLFHSLVPPFPTPSSVYCPRTNAIYSLTDGSLLWQGDLPSPYIGTATTANVIYSDGEQILITSYP